MRLYFRLWEESGTLSIPFISPSPPRKRDNFTVGKIISFSAKFADAS